jgi:protein-disulfide isomerase
MEKKLQNLLSICILLAGLLVGSLSIDIGELITGSGFSRHVLKNNDVLETNGKTWVGYTDPRVDVMVLTENDCDACDTDQALTWIRRVVPTLVARTVDYSSEEGHRMAIDHDITALPAFLFSPAIRKTNFYSQAGSLFHETGQEYALDMTKIGGTPGKFLKLPEVRGDDIRIGSDTAPLTVIEYSDFQCPYSKLFHSAIQKMIREYPNDIRFVYKHFPLPFHPQANNAALAAECANEQGRFVPYGDLLFAKQDDWGKSTGTGKFKTYASILGLERGKFNTCLDTKKYADKIVATTEEAKVFGITGTPGTFVGDHFINGAETYDELKSIIDENLAK